MKAPRGRFFLSVLTRFAIVRKRADGSTSQRKKGTGYHAMGRVAWSGLSGDNVGYRADVSCSGMKTCPLGHRALPAESPLHAAHGYNSVPFRRCAVLK